jgi:hypothetical protein
MKYMKAFFAKLKISNALDSGKRLPVGRNRETGRGENIEEFAVRISQLDEELKKSVPQLNPPEALHASIMQSVCKAHSSQQTSEPIGLRWLPASAVAAVLVFGICWSLQSSRPVPIHEMDEQAFDAAATALEMGNKIGTVPSMAVEPVSDELDRLNQDISNTAQFVLASIP